ncbi:MAG TPA: tetratricopeptide repeat protein [Vicinamibacteria bacterium]|nr:tetratricopeptide repeat protein [Vicinamibacteria bacterium]
MSLAILLLSTILTAEERRSFEAAITLHLASDLEGAMRGYGEILEVHPDFVPARLYRAEALWLLGKREEAREELSRAQEDLLLVRILERAFGKSVGSDSLVAKLSDAYPLEQRRFLATGTPALLLLSMGDYKDAIPEYRRVALVDPEDATLHRQLGAAFSGAKLFLPAVEAFERVVAAAPEDVAAWRQLGSGNLVLQRWEPAIVALEKAIELAGEDGGLLLALGYAHERKPDIEKALELYRRAVRLAPESGRPHYRIGRALMAQGKLEEAEKAFTKSSSLDPKVPEPLGFLGEIQLKRGDNDLALATLERAVEVDPEYFEAYYHLAQVYRRMGRVEEARKALALYEELKRKKRGVLSQEEVLALR